MKPLTDWIDADGTEPALNQCAWVEPEYRGPELPPPMIRRAFGQVMAFDWSHDGGADDILRYRVWDVQKNI